jgi:hypothetical protein
MKVNPEIILEPYIDFPFSDYRLYIYIQDVKSSKPKKVLQLTFPTPAM